MVYIQFAVFFFSRVGQRSRWRDEKGSFAGVAWNKQAAGREEWR